MVTLTVVNPSNGVDYVLFYRDTNGFPGLQVGDDEYIFFDTTRADGFKATISTEGLAARAYTYYAFGGNLLSSGITNTVQTTNTVRPAPGGSISGIVWNDANGNGTKQTAEGVLSNWSVYLDLDGDSIKDGNEPSKVTNANGAYSFTGLGPGTYRVREVVKSGWTQTSPRTTNLTANGTQGVIPVTPTVVPGSAATGPLYELPNPDDRGLMDAEGNSLTRINQFRADPRFSNINGAGYSVVVIDSGIDLNHPFFGPDANNDGISDRIVYSYDFSGTNDADASDTNGHGSNVASIVGGASQSVPGVAPGVNIIALKVFPDGENPSYADSDVKQALQWAVDNAAAYNIVAVNLSLGVKKNFATVQTGVYSAELAALVNKGIIPVAAAANHYVDFQSPGVSYPAADANAWAVSAVYDANVDPKQWGDGAIDYTTGADRIASFSQRHTVLTDIFAPGPMTFGADQSGGVNEQGGTSQAAPYVAGIVALMQQLAVSTLGRRLGFIELRDLMRSTGVTIFDGDDENDNVTNTNASYKRVDVYALGQAIFAMGSGSAGSHVVSVTANQNVLDKNFGNRQGVTTAPDLTPHKPAGWSGPLVLSSVTGTNTGATTFQTTDTIYLDWAVANVGNANTTQAFKVRVLVDGVQKSTWTRSTVLNASTLMSNVDFSLGKLSAGAHTIKLEVDYQNQQPESIESNNSFTQNITVTAPVAKPTITIVATDANASETPGNPGVFTVTRTGSTASQLVVTLTRSGTALNITDFAGIPLTVTIPAGSASKTIQVLPVNDTLVEGSETVALALAPKTAYVVGAASTATVTIVDNDNPSTAPSNTFAGRTALTGANVSASGNSNGATKQPGEPAHAGNTGGKSVWWKWTAPRSGQVTIDTAGSNFDTLLAVYKGTSLNTLSLVKSNNNHSAIAPRSRVIFNAVAGTVYAIAVDGVGGASGAVKLSIKLATPLSAFTTGASGTPGAFSSQPVSFDDFDIDDTHLSSIVATSFQV